jgi:glycosyltransferase involved in cell wall biosynthesis
MDAPLISVVLCTYNGETYLREQIESILTQTYSNIELIIVDDCSIDNSAFIAKTFSKNDKRVKCFINTTNLGFNKNFERAINLTSGKYIAISDQDDIWEAHKLQVLINNIGNNWLIFSNSSYITYDGRTTGKKLIEGSSFLNYNFKSVLILNFVTGHTCLISREFIDYILPFPAKGYYDWWMGFVALYHQRIAYADEMLTKYRMHDASVTQTDLLKDEFTFKVIDLKNSVTMMENFTNYRNIKAKDKKLIQSLKIAYEKKLTQSYNPLLVMLIFKHYHAIFPNFRKRGVFSRFKFAIRYSVKLGR